MITAQAPTTRSASAPGGPIALSALDVPTRLRKIRQDWRTIAAKSCQSMASCKCPTASSHPWSTRQHKSNLERSERDSTKVAALSWRFKIERPNPRGAKRQRSDPSPHACSAGRVSVVRAGVTLNGYEINEKVISLIDRSVRSRLRGRAHPRRSPQ